MNTIFTDLTAAIEEAHFIQHDLNKTAYMVVDQQNNLHVVTDTQYAAPTWATFRVIETFHRGGCNEHKRVFRPVKKPR